MAEGQRQLSSQQKHLNGNFFLLKAFGYIIFMAKKSWEGIPVGFFNGRCPKHIEVWM